MAILRISIIFSKKKKWVFLQWYFVANICTENYFIKSVLVSSYYMFPLSKLIFMYLKQNSTNKIYIFKYIKCVLKRNYGGVNYMQVIMLRLCVCVCFRVFQMRNIATCNELNKVIGVVFPAKWGRHIQYFQGLSFSKSHLHLN